MIVIYVKKFTTQLHFFVNLREFRKLAMEKILNLSPEILTTQYHMPYIEMCREDINNVPDGTFYCQKKRKHIKKARVEARRDQNVQSHEVDFEKKS